VSSGVPEASITVQSSGPGSRASCAADDRFVGVRGVAPAGGDAGEEGVGRCGEPGERRAVVRGEGAGGLPLCGIEEGGVEDDGVARREAGAGIGEEAVVDPPGEVGAVAFGRKAGERVGAEEGLADLVRPKVDGAGDRREEGRHEAGHGGLAGAGEAAHGHEPGRRGVEVGRRAGEEIARLGRDGGAVARAVWTATIARIAARTARKSGSAASAPRSPVRASQALRQRFACAARPRWSRSMRRKAVS
jgi:hypothetical protein